MIAMKEPQLDVGVVALEVQNRSSIPNEMARRTDEPIEVEFARVLMFRERPPANRTEIEEDQVHSAFVSQAVHRSPRISAPLVSLSGFTALFARVQRKRGGAVEDLDQPFAHQWEVIA